LTRWYLFGRDVLQNQKFTENNMFYHEKLFDYVVSTVLAEGGDGDFTIECRLSALQQTVDEFEIWRKSSPAKDWVREDTKYSISFGENREGIVFKSVPKDREGWTFRVTI
jgi:hypothetical protein